MKRLLIILGCLFITSCGEVLPNKSEPSPQEPTPIEQEPKLAVRPAPTETPPYTESCSDNPEMAELENAEVNVYKIWMACLIKNHEGQMRQSMSFHPILNEIAQSRAEDAAIQGWPVPHIDSNGYGPNYAVCAAGYKTYFCPASKTANGIESLVGALDPEEALNGWLNSPAHKAHILAEYDYETYQTNYGIGYAYVVFGPNYEYASGVWIFIAVHPPLDEDGEPVVTEITLFAHEPPINITE